jgi:hypothetical protein
MRVSFSIKKIEDDKVFLSSDKEDIIWPKEKLPKNIKVGDDLSFLISFESHDGARREELAKDVLNEIFLIEKKIKMIK